MSKPFWKVMSSFEMKVWELWSMLPRDWFLSTVLSSVSLYLSLILSLPHTCTHMSRPYRSCTYNQYYLRLTRSASVIPSSWMDINHTSDTDTWLIESQDIQDIALLRETDSWGDPCRPQLVSSSLCTGGHNIMGSQYKDNFTAICPSTEIT